MAQRWPNVGQKMAQDGPNNPKNLGYTIQLSSTAREIFIYLKNPEFELKKNYLAFRRDRKLRIPPSSSQITGCLFPSAYFEKVNKSSQTKSNQTNQP